MQLTIFSCGFSLICMAKYLEDFPIWAQVHSNALGTTSRDKDQILVSYLSVHTCIFGVGMDHYTDSGNLLFVACGCGAEDTTPGLAYLIVGLDGLSVQRADGWILLVEVEFSLGRFLEQFTTISYNATSQRAKTRK